MDAKPVEGSICEPIPFNSRVEGIAAIAVTLTDIGFAADGIVYCTRQPGPPLRAGVKSDLTDDIHQISIVAQGDRIISVEVDDGAGNPICNRKDRRVCAAIGDHQHIPVCK